MPTHESLVTSLRHIAATLERIGFGRRAIGVDASCFRAPEVQVSSHDWLEVTSRLAVMPADWDCAQAGSGALIVSFTARGIRWTCVVRAEHLERLRAAAAKPGNIQALPAPAEG